MSISGPCSKPIKQLCQKKGDSAIEEKVTTWKQCTWSVQPQGLTYIKYKIVYAPARHWRGLDHARAELVQEKPANLHAYVVVFNTMECFWKKSGFESTQQIDTIRCDEWSGELVADEHDDLIGSLAPQVPEAYSGVYGVYNNVEIWCYGIRGRYRVPRNSTRFSIPCKLIYPSPTT